MKNTEMKTILVTKIEVINTIKSLKTKNSSGYEEFSNKILKSCANEEGELFTFMCNSLLASGIYPERLIHKKGDKTKIANHRPIPLLISFSKILKTLMFTRLNQYLQAKKKKIEFQSCLGLEKEMPLKKGIFT